MQYKLAGLPSLLGTFLSLFHHSIGYTKPLKNAAASERKRGIFFTKLKDCLCVYKNM